MSDSFTLDDDPIVLVVPSSANIPPGNITEAEWLQIKDRVTVVEASGIADLSDVDLSGIEDGQALLWDESANAWHVGTVQSGLDSVFDWDTAVGDGPFTSLQVTRPLNAEVHPGNPQRARIGVNVGTTVSTVARGNHTHQRPAIYRPPILPGGYMSGGTRSLASQNVTLPAGKMCTVTARVDMQVRGGDPGPAYYRLSITIDGHTRTSPAGDSGFWGVQGVPSHPSFSHMRYITGAGSAINVSASIAYYDGSGFYTDRGDLDVRIEYDR